MSKINSVARNILKVPTFETKEASEKHIKDERAADYPHSTIPAPYFEKLQEAIEGKKITNVFEAFGKGTEYLSERQDSNLRQLGMDNTRRALIVNQHADPDDVRSIPVAVARDAVDVLVKGIDVAVTGALLGVKTLLGD